MQHQSLQHQDNRKYRIKKHGALHIRTMLIRNYYLEINTTFQLEKDDRQYSVMANQNTISNYLSEDIFQYKDNVDELMEKLLLLENVDFELSTNGRMLTQMVDHQDKPDDQTKDN